MNGIEEQTSSIPFTECESRVAGHRLRYLKAGTGAAVVLIHGLMGYSFSFRFTIPELAKHFTVYAPDQLGIGFSDRPAELDYSLRASAERMLEWIGSLGLAEIYLFGTSHGGAVAAAMAAVAQDRGTPRIRKLILGEAVNPWSTHGRKRVAALTTAMGAAIFRQTFPAIVPAVPYFIRRMYGDPSKITPDTLEGYLASVRRNGTADYGLGVVRTWHDDLKMLETMYPKLSGIPTLIVWGDRDCAVSPSSAHKLHEALPGSELVMLPGIGHLPYEECPAEFNRILLDFLQRS